MNSFIFDNQFFLGYISKVNANRVVVHIPSSKYLTQFYHYGEQFQGGIINSYVVIEGDIFGFIGKVTSVEIPEKERLELSSKALKQKEFHPLMHLELLSIFDYYQVKFTRTVMDFPNIGAKVYLANDRIVDKYITEVELSNHELKMMDFAKLANSNVDINIDFSFQSLFSRHAAIVGTTGSGKSWTTSSLICNLLENKQKVILIDATGEYANLAKKYCDNNNQVVLGETHVLSYKKFSIEDLFNLLNPAPGVQAPKLKEAIKSLKLIPYCDDKEKVYVTDMGQNIQTIVKEGKERQPFLDLLNTNIALISQDDCNFDIRALATQIENECIWPSPRGNYNKHLYGDTDEGTYGHCTSLITRIENLIQDDFHNKIFDFQQSSDLPDLLDNLDDFIKKDHSNRNFLYIDVSKVPFNLEMREIVVDIIGQKLLTHSRVGMFRDKPLTVFLDEAHQFLNKYVSKDDQPNKLMSFESIAKEGRKYGLFLSITTQLPRDIPVGILSQIGTFIIHRLINQRDKEIIMHSLPSISNNIINYLPTLGQGEAIVSSNEFIDNLFVKINEPKIEPKSTTPRYREENKKS